MKWRWPISLPTICQQSHRFVICASMSKRVSRTTSPKPSGSLPPREGLRLTSSRPSAPQACGQAAFDGLACLSFAEADVTRHREERRTYNILVQFPSGN